MLVGIEQLVLSPARIDRAIPKISRRAVELVKELGQVVPVVVRPLGNRHYEILANAESWIAVQRAGLHQVEIVVRDLVDDEAARVVNRSVERDPIDEALWFRSCLESGNIGGRELSVSELARSLDLGRSYVAHSLRLLELSTDVQSLIRSGKLRVGHAKAILSIKTVRGQAQLALDVINQKLTVREAETRARSITLKPADTANKSTTTLHLEKTLSEIVGSAIEIDESEGKLIIDYGSNNDVLAGILLRLGYQQGRDGQEF